jgi:hypothetical protein
MDSMRQSEATRAAIKAIGKINVYDRRWNDLLGQIWVDNYKDKN